MYVIYIYICIDIVYFYHNDRPLLGESRDSIVILYVIHSIRLLWPS